MWRAGVEIVEGDVLGTLTTGLDDCCAHSHVVDSAGWTWRALPLPLTTEHVSGAQLSYTFRSGALAKGHDITNASWTYNESVEQCNAHPECVGF